MPALSEKWLRTSRAEWRRRELEAQAAFRKAHAKRVLRDRQLKRYLDQHPPGAAKAVRWSLAQVGTLEHPAGSNSGPGIDTWIRAGGGVPGWAWCQYFADAALVHGGGRQLKSGYTVAVVQWAREGRYGLKLVPIAQRQGGDFLYFKWPGVSHDFCDHVGVCVDPTRQVEGNTSSGNSGSQNNGGGVFLRKWSDRAPYCVAVVRPDYS